MSEIQFTEVKVPTKKLWNPKSFVALAMFFSFLPAGILSALNYGRIDDQKKKWTTLLATIGGFILFIALVIIVPFDGFKYIGYGINAGVGTYFFRAQRNLYNEHIQNGGEKASLVLPIILSVVFTGLVILVTTVVLIFSSYTSDTSDKYVSYGKNNVHYTNNITKEQAKKLGDYLDEQHLLFNDNGVDIKIDKDNDVYVFSCIVNSDQLNDENTIKSVTSVVNLVSSSVFDNAKMRLDFCDNKFNVLKSINTSEQF